MENGPELSEQLRYEAFYGTKMPKLSICIGAYPDLYDHIHSHHSLPVIVILHQLLWYLVCSCLFFSILTLSRSLLPGLAAFDPLLPPLTKLCTQLR